MNRRPMLLLVALLILAPTVADATTLTITEGDVFSAYFASGAETYWSFRGDGFSVDGVWWNAPELEELKAGAPIFLASNPWVSVTVGNLICETTATPNFDADCGVLTLTSSGPETFTAMGFLNVGSGFDLIGQGRVQERLCTEVDSCNTGQPRLLYTFAPPASVPEPATWLLLMPGLALMAMLLRRCSCSSLQSVCSARSSARGSFAPVRSPAPSASVVAVHWRHP